MKKSRHVGFRVGLLLYGVSFLLPTVSDPLNSRRVLRGYETAVVALGLCWPLQNPVLDSSGVEYASVVISALINLVFPAAAYCSFLGDASRVTWILRSLLLLMLPFCWIVFHYLGLRPYVGYYAWTVAMLLTLFFDLVRSNCVNDFSDTRP
jgi:hypothetical protein